MKKYLLAAVALSAALVVSGCDETAQAAKAPTPAPKPGAVKIERDVRPSILAEASVAVLRAPMHLVEDAAAANGRYAISPEKPDHTEMKNDGDATFSFKVTEPGEYILWMRAKWCCSCGKSLDVSIDGGEFLTVLDPTFQKWHWVRLKRPPFKLAAGDHTMVVKTREDGSAFDQILLTQDTDYTPTEIEKADALKRNVATAPAAKTEAPKAKP